MGDLILSFYATVSSSTTWLRLGRRDQRERGRDGSNERVPAQRRDDIPGNLRRDPRLCLPGRGSQMRGSKHTLVSEEPPQDRVVPDGFLAEDIERCAFQTILFERREQSRFVDQAAARAVHQVGSWLEQAQFPRANE